MSALVVPARSVAAPGSRAVLFDVLGAMPGGVLLVHSLSAAWADEAGRQIESTGRALHRLPARGEPTLPKLESALDDLRGLQIGVVVAIGGGSAIDLAKALAALLPAPRPPLDHLEVVGRGLPLDVSPLPMIALPTTAGTGAEATKNAVIDVPDHGRKVSLREVRMVPRVAILDAELTLGLPWPVTLMTGMDAITQLIEPFVCTRATPQTDFICRAAIGPAMRALLALSRGDSLAARHTMILAAHLGGIALANAGLGAVHGLAGVIGGRTGAPHGAICARLLPEILEVNRLACQSAGLDTGRFDEIDGMVADAFGAPAAKASDLLRGFLRDQDLPSLLGRAATPPDPNLLAQEAEVSSSMKANPVALPRAVLAQAVRAADPAFG
ncbi:iron-containing alcohol dehydrogenase [Thetidibacter halocola]|uniref:Iron-containing alcohol dehydrogenase n=1 Tax=Thetidibacter halocola TaxID=2827239 RepID=A0A8J8B7N0_9RHOB|nr:iron-containing alcohol dehydrogenase [Thetidibacter halocola]MBS0123720.1 iron-containing alcohol dehydrogenase [Thetidibacter halocola]